MKGATTRFCRVRPLIVAWLVLCGWVQGAFGLTTDIYALRGSPSNNLYLVNLAAGNDSVAFANYPMTAKRLC